MEMKVREREFYRKGNFFFFFTFHGNYLHPPLGFKVTAFFFFGKKDEKNNEGRGTKQRTIVNKERERLNSVLRENHLKKQNEKKM